MVKSRYVDGLYKCGYSDVDDSSGETVLAMERQGEKDEAKTRENGTLVLAADAGGRFGGSIAALYSATADAGCRYRYRESQYTGDLRADRGAENGG